MKTPGRTLMLKQMGLSLLNKYTKLTFAPNKSLKAVRVRSLDSFSLGMLRILCPALRCPLALR